MVGWLLTATVTLTVLLLAAPPRPVLAAPADPADASTDYARPQQRVDIGGRRLNLFCFGSKAPGMPTVVFDSGSGQAGWDWLRVHAAVAQRTLACVYDRAGFGFSDPLPAARAATSDHALDDLQRLLKAAEIAPPYVFVAHSYAAMHVQLFAYRHPKQVAGLVLVDGHHEDEFSRIDRITQGKLTRMKAQLDALGAGCVAAANAGFVPGSDAAAQCLTRGVSPYLIPGQPQSAMNKAVERDNEAMQREVCALSSRGSSPVIAGAGHAIHIDRPQAVIDAVDAVLKMAATPPR